MANDTDWGALGATADGLVDLWKVALISGAESGREQSGQVQLLGHSLYAERDHQHALQVFDLFIERLGMRAMRALMDDKPGLPLLLGESGRLIDNDVARRFLQLRLKAVGRATSDVRQEMAAITEYLRSARLMTADAVLALSRVQAALDVVSEARTVLTGGSDGETSDEDVIRELLSLPANTTPLIWEVGPLPREVDE